MDDAEDVLGRLCYSVSKPTLSVGYDQRDQEMRDLTTGVIREAPRRKHFDWCILAVMGYICCPLTGLCAMYYAMRSNHGHDFNVEEYKIDDANTKAKVLTILSIVLGILQIIVMIIAIVKITEAVSEMTDALVTHNRNRWD